MGRITGSRYVDILFLMSPTVDNSLVEDELDSFSEEDMSVEVISPPRRPVTCSVSAKRTADEMEPGDNDTLLISSPRPRKVRRVTTAHSVFPFHSPWPIAHPSTESTNKIPLFTRSRTPEPIKVGGILDAVGTDAPSHLDKDYFELENPWEDVITYF